MSRTCFMLRIIVTERRSVSLVAEQVEIPPVGVGSAVTFILHAARKHAAVRFSV